MWRVWVQVDKVDANVIYLRFEPPALDPMDLWHSPQEVDAILLH